MEMHSLYKNMEWFSYLFYLNTIIIFVSKKTSKFIIFSVFQPTEWGIIDDSTESTVSVGDAETCDKQLLFLNILDEDLSEGNKHTSEVGEEPKFVLLPASSSLGPQQIKGKRKMMSNITIILSTQTF